MVSKTIDKHHLSMGIQNDNLSCHYISDHNWLLILDKRKRRIECYYLVLSMLWNGNISKESHWRFLQGMVKQWRLKKLKTMTTTMWLCPPFHCWCRCNACKKEQSFDHMIPVALSFFKKSLCSYPRYLILSNMRLIISTVLLIVWAS